MRIVPGSEGSNAAVSGEMSLFFHLFLIAATPKSERLLEFFSKFPFKMKKMKERVGNGEERGEEILPLIML